MFRGRRRGRTESGCWRRPRWPGRPRQTACPAPLPSPAAPSAALNRIGSVTDLKPGRLMWLQLGQFLVGQDGRFQLDQTAAFGLGLEQIALGADRRLGRGDDFLADAVNRRVGDLREELLEIVVKQSAACWRAPPAACRCPSSRAACTPSRAIGPMMNAQVLERVAERLLALQDGLVIGSAACTVGSGSCSSSTMMFCPATLGTDARWQSCSSAPRPRRCGPLGVHQEHAARLQPAFVRNALRRARPARRLPRP